MKLNIVYPSFLLFLTCHCHENATDSNEVYGIHVEPDAFRNISELIRSKGYPAEEHQVLTSAGYILGVQRIPHGRSIYGRSRAVRPAVLLHHGLTSSGADFVANFPDQSLGFILSDAGYDVWITNARGNTYSRKHTTIKPSSTKFWKFSWNEMALEDLPSTIDYILNVTGQRKIFYAGHSMGSTVIFALLSARPEYNDKVQVAVALAPSVFYEHTKSSLRYLAPYLNQTEFVLTLLGKGELEPNSLVLDVLKSYLCQANIQICGNWGASFLGMTTDRLNVTRLPVYLAHLPAGSSVRSVLHYVQLYKYKRFQQYDLGYKENMEKYNQPTPPEYPLENITAPIALMWGLNDGTSTPLDVKTLAGRLRSVILNYQVPYPKWGHVDFVIALDANKYVYQKILDVFEESRRLSRDNNVNNLNRQNLIID